MKENPQYVVDVVGYLVKRVQDELLGQLKSVDSTIQAVNYLYGHGAEILATLKERDESISLSEYKYPLVALIQDFPERRNPQPGIYCTAEFSLIFAYHTLPELKTEDRYKVSFKPILYPIYMEFMRQLKLSGLAMLPYGDMPHEKIDHPYFGRQNKNAGYDFMDAIEVANLELKLYQSCYDEKKDIISAGCNSLVLGGS